MSIRTFVERPIMVDANDPRLKELMSLLAIGVVQKKKVIGVLEAIEENEQRKDLILTEAGACAQGQQTR